MKRNGRKLTAVLHDLGRLVAPMDVLYQVGNMIYRRSLRYTLLTAGIGVIGFLAHSLNLPGLTIGQAVLLPLIVGGTALVGGFVMKLVPRMISTRLLTVAQACGLNLMEDYRKQAADEHLDALWERLFAHECSLRVAVGLPAMGGAGDEARRDETPASARERFIARARQALDSHLPQIREMHQGGLDLRFFEDWRDGACLDRSDTKLVEQFEGNSTLAAVRREVKLVGMAAMGRFWLGQLAQKLWFFVIMRSVAVEVGLAIQRLNRQYDTDSFNAQAILWPGEEDQPWLAQFDGSRQAVLDLRRQLIRGVFGPDFDTASAVIDHMLYCPGLLASELRMRYDPEYCTPSALGCDVVSDLKAIGAKAVHVRSAEQFARRAAIDIEACDRIIAAHRPDLLGPTQAFSLRAVRIAMHVGRKGLRRKLGGAIGPEVSPEQFNRHVAPLVDAAAADPCRYAHRLVAVRMHHELTRLARKEYRGLIEALAYEQDAPPATGP